jgi:hypothetical protein
MYLDGVGSCDDWPRYYLLLENFRDTLAEFLDYVIWKTTEALDARARHVEKIVSGQKADILPFQPVAVAAVS